jgi:hypothetical protein
VLLEKLSKKRMALWHQKMYAKNDETHVGFTRKELAKMCTMVDASLNNQLQGLFLPKCKVSKSKVYEHEGYFYGRARPEEYEHVSISQTPRMRRYHFLAHTRAVHFLFYIGPFMYHSLRAEAA